MLTETEKTARLLKNEVIHYKNRDQARIIFFILCKSGFPSALFDSTIQIYSPIGSCIDYSDGCIGQRPIEDCVGTRDIIPFERWYQRHLNESWVAQNDRVSTKFNGKTVYISYESAQNLNLI